MVLPSRKAAIQWKRFFKRNQHAPALALEEGDRKVILDFLQEHAADSDRPTVPGL